MQMNSSTLISELESIPTRSVSEGQFRKSLTYVFAGPSLTYRVMIGSFHIAARRIALFCFVCSLAACVSAQDVSLPAKDRFHLFLLVGQSNMAGRGELSAQDTTPHPRVLMLDKSGKWVPAIDPMHFDKPAAGVGLGKTFGQLMAEANPGITVGLIPCAVGGSPIDAWKPGEYYAPTKSHPWDDCLERAEIALKSGTLSGILWHQGESDSNRDLSYTYEAKLHDLILRFREKLEAKSVPFVVGQMGKFEDVPWDEFHDRVDAAHRSLPLKIPNTAYVSAEGLQHKGDKVHFDAASYRKLGNRYFEAYQKVTRIAK